MHIRCNYCRHSFNLSREYMVQAVAESNAKKQKYHAEGHHRISGDTGVFWQRKWFNNQTVIRTHAKHYSKAAWALFAGSGCWIRVRPASTDGVTNIFAILCEALANNRRVDVYIRNGQIDQATLR